MADNTILPLGTEDGDTYASDEIAGVKIQRVKLVLGADGVNGGDVASGNPIPVTGTVTASGPLTDTQLRATAVDVNITGGSSAGTEYTEADTDASITGTAIMWEDTSDTLRSVSAAKPLPISVATIPSHAVTNAGTFAVQASIAAAQTLATVTNVTTLGTVTNVVHVDDNSSTLSVDDGAGSITVDNAGTFAVQAAEADGANVTLGAKADAKSTATDTTAITAMSVLKQISASVQAPPSQAVTNAGTFAVQAAESDGANVTLGAKADAKSTATDTTAITAMSVLKQISASVQAPPSQAVTNVGTFVVQVDGSALTSLQLIDDVVYTDDTSTHATGTSKGALLMAAATPTDSAVNANDIGAVAMTTDRKLHVSVQDALPAGSAAIGKLAANAGVTIGAVEIAAAQTLSTVTTVGTVSTVTNVVHVDDNSGSLTVDGTVGTKELPDATSTFAPSSTHSTAYEASRDVKGSAGVLYSLVGYNSRTTAQFIQLHNATTLPANTAIPVITFLVSGSSNFSLDFGGKFGRFFSTGISICNSSTGPTLTVGSADCWFDVLYQ